MATKTDGLEISLCFIFDKVEEFVDVFAGKGQIFFLKQLTFLMRFDKIDMYVFLFILKGQKT